MRGHIVVTAVKILQIIPNLSVGGAEKFVVSLCNELAKDPANQVFVCCLYSLDRERGKLKELLNESVTVIELGKKLGFDLSIYFKLFRTLRRVGPDIDGNRSGNGQA